MMARWALSVVLLFSFLLSASVAAPSGEAPETIVARVDRYIITRQDVLQRVTAGIRAVGSQLPAEEEAKLRTELFLTVRQGLIEEQLLLAEAGRLLKRQKPFAKKLEREAIRHIDRERRRVGGHAEFREALRKAGMKYKDYVEKAREQIMRRLVVELYVDRNLSVSPAEMIAYYEEHLERYHEPAQVKHRQIFIRAMRDQRKDGLDFDKARQTTDYVMGLLQKQHDFADLARKYSEGPHAQEGGLWDFVRQGVRPEPLDKLIFSLPVGEAGGPVQTNIGYTIIMVEARRKARTIPFEEVQAQLEKQLLQEEWQRRYKQLIKRLEKEHHVLRLD